MSYSNINNPANYQLQSFGQDGMRTISTSQDYVEGEYYRVLVATEDSTVSATSMVGDDLVEVDVFAGTTIYGLFTAVSVSLGEVTAYLAGRTNIDDVWAYIRAYGEANGAVIEGEDCAKAAISPLLDKYYAQASLVMVPSLYKTSIVYSERPLSTDGQLTFTRNSNATRVNSRGLVEKVRTNLILQSNTFDTTWTASNITLTSGQSGYDGTSDAWKVEATSAGGNLFQYNSTSGVSAFSVYAKAGNVSWIRLRYDNTSTADIQCWVNLSDGSIGVDNGIASYTEDMGGGWWRVVVQANTSDLSNLRFLSAASDGANSATGEYIYIQDAQLETGDVATDYIPTTTAAVSVGPVSGLPRLDYSGGATCPSLLLEPQRTNLALYSEQFDNAYWGKGAGVTLTANQYTSPDSYVSGDKLIGATGTDRNGDVIARIVSVSSSTTYVASIYVYKDTATQCTLYLRDGSTGTIVSTSVTLAAGWQRIECSITTGVATTQVNFYLGNTNGNIGIWGAQLEAGAYATSYIPTLGSAVTRLADDCVKTSATSIIGQTEGAVYFEWDYQNTGSTGGNIPISLDAGSGYNLYFWAKTDGNYLAECFNGGVAQFSFAGSMGSFGTKKIAIAYKNNDFALYINGVLANTDTSGTVPALNRLYIGRFYLSAVLYNISSGIKQVLLFPTRLTNAQLAELTTL